MDRPLIAYEGLGVILVEGVRQYQQQHEDQQEVLRWLMKEYRANTVAKNRGWEEEENKEVYKERAEEEEENQEEEHKGDQDKNKENAHNPGEEQEADWEGKEDWWWPIWEVENRRKVKQSSLDDQLKSQLVITEIFLENIEWLPATAEHSYSTLLHVQDREIKSFWVAGKHERGETG